MTDATLRDQRAARAMTVSAEDVAALRRQFPDAFGNRRKQATTGLIWGIAIGYLLWSFWFFDFAKLLNFNERATRMFTEFFVWGSMADWDFAGIYKGLAETIAMAFLGTLLGSIAALLIAFAAARNTMPQFLLRHTVRRFLDLLRGIDSLIWALVFVRAVGLGPLAGVLSIFVSDAGTLSKLYSEAIENVDRKQIEGVRASGASPIKTIRFAYLPQIAPVFISLSLYSFESSVRSATILGIVGAGGIGKVLVDRFRAGFFDQVSFVVINILICVFVIDWLSGKVRAHFIGEKPH